MDNIELEKKVKELIHIENYFDMILAIKDFEKEYKESDFFKITKKPLKETLKEAKIWYWLAFDGIEQKMQSLIDNVSLDNLNNLFAQIGDIYEKENLETLDTLDAFKALIK